MDDQDPNSQISENTPLDINPVQLPNAEITNTPKQNIGLLI